MEEELQLRRNFSANLQRYRKAAGWTQSELAEKLNYTDKSVSKWERGDGLPDLTVTAQISALFGVSIDDLLSAPEESSPKKKPGPGRRLYSFLLSLALPWLCAVVLFFFCSYIAGFPAWWFFILAIPATAVVAVVLTCLWWDSPHQFAAVSALLWTVPIPLLIMLPFPGLWLLFIISAALQVMTVLWFLRRKED